MTTPTAKEMLDALDAAGVREDGTSGPPGYWDAIGALKRIGVPDPSDALMRLHASGLIEPLPGGIGEVLITERGAREMRQ